MDHQYSRFWVSAAVAAAAALFTSAALAQSPCADSVRQGIGPDGNPGGIWTAQQIAALCTGAESSTEPRRCFERVMAGGVNWGGGTQWDPNNARALCAGATNAEERVGCFQEKISRRIDWRQAIDACRTTSAGSAGRPQSPQSVPQRSLPPIVAPSAPRGQPGDIAACIPRAAPNDCDGDGARGDVPAIQGGDCNDRNPNQYPGAQERSGNSIDEDCNPQTLGEDFDGDGSPSTSSCNPQPDGQMICGADCAEGDPKIGPRAQDILNDVDDDCDGAKDEDQPRDLVRRLLNLG